MMARIALWAPCVCWALTTGCVPLTNTCYEGAFKNGLRGRLAQTADAGGVLHVVMIHGIGDHQPGYDEPLARSLGAMLHLSPNPDNVTNALPLSPGITNCLREFSYASATDQRRIKFHELTWTPTTLPAKTNAFAADRRLSADRVLLNKSIKDAVMDEGFGDAILYLNPAYRTNLQEPILQTIERVSDQARPGDQVVLIASSLGSKMTFDAVERWVTNTPGSARHRGVTNFVAHTTAIIMLANQLALLNLASKPFGAEPPLPTNSIQAWVGLKHRQRTRALGTQAPGGGLQADQNRDSKDEPFILNIIAATDPNDLLSYPITEAEVFPDDSSRVHVFVSNLYSHNDGAWLGVFVNPETAHDNYMYNPWLLHQLVEGYPWRPGKCFPKSVPETFSCDCGNQGR